MYCECGQRQVKGKVMVDQRGGKEPSTRFATENTILAVRLSVSRMCMIEKMNVTTIHAFFFIRTLRFELGFWFLFLE